MCYSNASFKKSIPNSIPLVKRKAEENKRKSARDEKIRNYLDIFAKSH